MDDQHDLTTRLKAISTETLPAEVKAAHLSRLVDEVESPVEARPSAWSTERRLVLSAAALVVLLGSAAALIMANTAMPGDGLYGPKRAIEDLVGVVDSDLAASHRLEELELLIERRAAPDAILAAQARLSSNLQPLADDHPLRQRARRLVLGRSSTADELVVAIDWAGGESFAASLADGELVFVEPRLGQDGSPDFELTVTGSWLVTDRSGVWMLTKPSTDRSGGREPTLGLRADAAGVTVLTGVEEPVESASAAPVLPDGPRSTLTVDGATVPSTSSTVEGSTVTSTPTSGPPTTQRPPRTTTTSKPTTTEPSTTSKPTTTTTRPTTTTTQPTTTTTQPTTTRGDDDDDDDDD